jgi:CelD/BcsL family acetyltransferase involved in cellulose biosynthesis
MHQGIEWVTDPAQLAALAGPWEALVAAEDHPFSDLVWLRAWWAAFGDGAQLCVCTHWRDGELTAALPLGLRRGRLFALSNYHQPLFRPPARDEQALRAVVDAALAESATELFIHALPESDAAMRALSRAAVDARRVLLVEPAHTSPIVDTGGDLEVYLRRLGATVKRRRRKLEREHEAAFRVDAGEENLNAALRRGFEVEASGWKSRAGTAVLSSADTVSFYTELAGAYRERGELRLAWLHVDGEPAAFNFCIERRRRLYLLKTGFNERFSSHAPGIVLHLLVVEHCFGSDLAAYELLGDAERWKLELATSERRHVRAWTYRRRPLPLARYVARRRAVPLLRTIRATVRAGR